MDLVCPRHIEGNFLEHGTPFLTSVLEAQGRKPGHIAGSKVSSQCCSWVTEVGLCDGVTLCRSEVGFGSSGREVTHESARARATRASPAICTQRKTATQ